MSTAAHRGTDFAEAIRSVADSVAAPLADAIDRDARFPHEAVAALRAHGALSAFVPNSLGGAGVDFSAIATACFDLARACSATGMVYAMHQIQVTSIVRHANGSAFFEEYLHDLSASERLIASVTSEVGVGGDLRASIAALVPDGDDLTFEKQAPTVSYGEHADDLLTTVRRNPEADRGNQVLVLTRGDEAILEQTGTWESLGMRGTCSPAYTVRGRIGTDHVLPIPFAEIAAQTMVPVTHILWAQVWLPCRQHELERPMAASGVCSGGVGWP